MLPICSGAQTSFAHPRGSSLTCGRMYHAVEPGEQRPRSVTVHEMRAAARQLALGGVCHAITYLAGGVGAAAGAARLARASTQGAPCRGRPRRVRSPCPDAVSGRALGWHAGG